MNSSQLIGILVTILCILAVALAAMALWRNGRGRRERLRERFGPEYDRLLQQHNGDQRRVEQELGVRLSRVRKLGLHELSEDERRQFSRQWQEAQERFVDTPGAAVRTAHVLVQDVMRARGYPVTETSDIEQRYADLSVDHAGVVQHYRAAHELHEANSRGDADTEQLRQALVHYRALFAELLHPRGDEAPPSQRLSPARV
ncbi:MAG TPA: hypothetical protein VG963_27015 [Polyangiaceae bacterium]|nr:hypothetical protein [Polyangiaceae bacterium]